MPPRHVTWAILAFWLATSGWFVYRDVWPRLESGEPVLFEMDLTDEARIDPAKTTTGASGSIRWTLTRNDQPAGWNETGIRYHTPEDPYELYGQLKLAAPGPLSGDDYLVRISSLYRVDWQGRCREFAAELTPNQAVPELRGTAPTRLEGWLRDRQCGVRWLNQSTEGGRAGDPQTVPVSKRGNVLNLLQPLNRMPGLYAGQRWQIPLVDLLAALTAGRTATLQLVEAQVQEDTLSRQHRQVPCWVVTYYKNGAIQGRTWVRMLDALVLQQEMRVAGDLGTVKVGDRLVLSRDMEN